MNIDIDFFLKFGFSKDDLPDGWKYNNFGVIQKTKGRVYCYIGRQIGFYNLQLYKRKNVSYCDLEIRDTDIKVLFDQAEKWFEQYSDGDLEKIHSDWWSPHNPAGYWAVEYKK